MSNNAKNPRPEGIAATFYADAEVVNGTGRTLLWVHQETCKDNGGQIECCAAGADCIYLTMPFEEMRALGVYLIETAYVARDAKEREAYG